MQVHALIVQLHALYGIVPQKNLKSHNACCYKLVPCTAVSLASLGCLSQASVSVTVCLLCGRSHQAARIWQLGRT
jgi:hypothetical protein